MIFTRITILSIITTYSAVADVYRYTNENGHVFYSDAKINLGFKRIIKTPPVPVELRKSGGVYEIPVMLNDVLKINLIFDSGAADVSISPDVALTLIKTGTITAEDWLSGNYYQLGDGSVVKSERFILRSVQVVNHIVMNVYCSISKSIKAPMLLGQSVLERLGKYTVDYEKGVVIFEGED
jgi:aspartyl protease family protein